MPRCILDRYSLNRPKCSPKIVAAPLSLSLSLSLSLIHVTRARRRGGLVLGKHVNRVPQPIFLRCVKPRETKLEWNNLAGVAVHQFMCITLQRIWGDCSVKRYSLNII